MFLRESNTPWLFVHTHHKQNIDQTSSVIVRSPQLSQTIVCKTQSAQTIGTSLFETSNECDGFAFATNHDTICRNTGTTPRMKGNRITQVFSGVLLQRWFKVSYITSHRVHKVQRKSALRVVTSVLQRPQVKLLCTETRFGVQIQTSAM